MAATKRNTVKEQYWRDFIERWQQSNLNIRQFCRQHQLSENSFYSWRRELRIREQEATLAQTDDHQATFVPVHIRADPASEPSDAIDIVLSSGRIVRVRPGFDKQLLGDVLEIVESC